MVSSSDDVASPVWDLDVFASFDYESESCWKPHSEDLCREAHRVLKEPLDTLDSDASIVHLRRQVSYIRLEADFLGARVIMFYKENQWPFRAGILGEAEDSRGSSLCLARSTWSFVYEQARVLWECASACAVGCRCFVWHVWH